MAARSMQEWFDAYGVSHQNPTNKAIHWVCVPVIYFCVVGLLWSIPTGHLPFVGSHLIAKLAVAFVVLFYARISVPIMVGMLVWSLFCLWICLLIDRYAQWPLWSFCTVLFIFAWVGQFYGHKVEGQKPSFLDDLQFLMIGPAWLMGFIYRRLGIAY